MVRRLAGVLTVVALAGATPAGATSAKVAIGDFRWSPMDVTVARGDSVTWFWIGPDTQHSITALEPANGVDSDPGDNAPEHQAGDEFSVTFDQPGDYQFHCKLHALVRGTLHVVDDPSLAGPSTEPDPQVVGDVVTPELTQARWAGSVRYGRGGELRYTLDEASRIRMDVMRPRRGVDRYMGGRSFSGHIGWNRQAFRGALRGKRLKPGRYYALLVAADAAGNRTKDVRVPFRVVR